MAPCELGPPAKGEEMEDSSSPGTSDITSMRQIVVSAISSYAATIALVEIMRSLSLKKMSNALLNVMSYLIVYIMNFKQI